MVTGLELGPDALPRAVTHCFPPCQWQENKDVFRDRWEAKGKDNQGRCAGRAKEHVQACGPRGPQGQPQTSDTIGFNTLQSWTKEATRMNDSPEATRRSVLSRHDGLPLWGPRLEPAPSHGRSGDKGGYLTPVLSNTTAAAPAELSAGSRATATEEWNL